jgi:Spy/CpxP family protein refolding chaperone
MKRKATLTLLIVVITSLALSACNHKQHRAAGHNDTRAIEYLTKKLDLSPTQRLEVASLQAEANVLKQEGEAMKQAWHAYALKQLKDEANSRQEIESFPQQQAARIEEIGKRFSAGISKLKTVLTPQQQQILVAELEKHDQHRNH